MSQRITEYKLLLQRTKDRNYDVRELLGCFVINGVNGSVVVYNNGDNRKYYTVCMKEKREICTINMVDNYIDKYAK